jgi:ABC-type ATPase with predicted acetyltransferase domain
MRSFSVSKQFETTIPISERTSAVMRMFGVSIDRLDEHRTTHRCVIDVEKGDIVYITGPSGAGKSVLLRELQNAIPADECISIEQIALPADRSAVDCIGFGQMSRTKSGSTIESLRLLGHAGLSDVFCILTPLANLSEGQQYRFRLACALATGRKYIFADEFCSNLDRITAAVIAYNVHRFAKRNKVTLFLASSHEDILADLQPDIVVVKHLTGPAEVDYPVRQVRRI